MWASTRFRTPVGIESKANGSRRPARLQRGSNARDQGTPARDPGPGTRRPAAWPVLHPRPGTISPGRRRIPRRTLVSWDSQVATATSLPAHWDNMHFGWRPGIRPRVHLVAGPTFQGSESHGPRGEALDPDPGLPGT